MSNSTVTDNSEQDLSVNPATNENEVPLPTQGHPSSSNAVSKLSAIVGDGTFESILKARSLKRKEKDEHCLAELRVTMSNMDKSLTQEIKRRVEGNKAIEDLSRQQIEKMESRLTQILEKKVETFQLRLTLLENKVIELNDRLEEERNNIPKDIEHRGKELQEILAKFQNEFKVERRERLSREGRLMKQLSDHTEELTTIWEQEIMERQKDAQELKSRLEHHESHRAQADLDFDSLIRTELKALREELEKETTERKVEDDEIVAALNRYTENLQKSLSMLD